MNKNTKSLTVSNSYQNILASVNKLQTEVFSVYRTPQFSDFINSIQSNITSSAEILGKIMANIHSPLQELANLSKMSEIANTVRDIRLPDFYSDYRTHVSDPIANIQAISIVRESKADYGYRKNKYQSEDVLDRLYEKLDEIERNQHELATKDDLQNFINNAYKAGIKQINYTESPRGKQKLFYALMQVVIGITVFFCTQPFASIFNGDKPSVQNNYYNKTVIIKQEKKAVDSLDIPEELIRDYRLAIHKTPVYSSKSTKSRVRDSLSVGSAVQIVIKKRNWSLVKYRTDQSYEVGWTLTRYIKHFS